MTRSLKSLLYASRFMATLGLLSLSLTEDKIGLWLQLTWVLLALSFLLDRYPMLEARLRRWETLSVIVLISLTVFDFIGLKNSIFVVVAHFLLLLQTLKLAGLKERKDCLQIGLIGFFQLLAACTLSADIWQAILLVLLIPGITALLFWNYTALVQEQSAMKAQWPDKSLNQMHAGLSLSAFPLNIALTLIVFILFPRLTLNVRVPGFSMGRSAYTDQMNLQQTGSVGRDQSVAAWMGFAEDTQREQWNGYLRGDVLDTFNGKEWVNSHKDGTRILQPGLSNAFLIGAGPAGVHPIHVTITLLNTTKNTLFMPGKPTEVIAPFSRLEMADAGDFHWSSTLQHPLQYQVFFIPESADVLSATPFTLSSTYADMSLPGLERTKDLSDRVAGSGSAFEKAHALEAYLRDHYQYSLNFGDTIPDNPVDYFLFESHQGFCIHFASALGVMLRLEHIPSRIVAGYYHGEWNPLAQQVLFREQDAHAWVEAWVDDHWITLDPSPHAGLEAAKRTRQRLIWLHLRETWDYLGYKWGRLIIEYDMYAQLRAWEKLRSHSDRVSSHWLTSWTRWRQRHLNGSSSTPEENSTNEQPLLRSHGVSIAVGIVFLAMIGLWSVMKRAGKSDVPVFYLRFLQHMARKGFEKKPFETAAEFAQRIMANFPQERGHIQETTNSYYRLRFRKK